MSDSQSRGYLPWRISDTASKADGIANHCFYMIAMGKWRPGSRLPAVRQIESEWTVNRQTVLKAYRALAARGLVYHKPNGSYFVAEQGPKRNFTRDRIEIENLYQEVLQNIKDATDLAPLGVLRMLARMAEAELREKPEVAFIECSRSQATDHAREITERIGIPVLPLVLDELRGRRMRIPPHIEVVFTTSFHADELVGLKATGKKVAALPIEISPDLLAELTAAGREIVFLETDRNLARRTAKDAVWMMGVENPRIEIVSDVAGFLETNLASRPAAASEMLYLIPQKEWELLDTKWQEHASVKPILCKLGDAAWEIIGGIVRIPFGLSV